VNVVYSLSERGVFVKNGATAHRYPAHIRNIADVSGAGDTVIAVAALCLALNADVAVIARLSNLAGGLVCERVGVVPIDKEWFQSIKNNCSTKPVRSFITKHDFPEDTRKDQSPYLRQ